jgi:NAD-dependent DNA ligase
LLFPLFSRGRFGTQPGYVRAESRDDRGDGPTSPVDHSRVVCTLFLALDGWDEKSAAGLLEEVEDSTDPSLAAFITAIGIPDVMATVARDLARHFGDLNALVDADSEELKTVDGIEREI